MEQRIRPLKSIRTEEEYESYKKSLERNLSEYKLFQNHREKLAELMATRALAYPEDSIERTSLETRRDLIENDEYAPLLERNITAYMLTIDEYEAKKENRSLFDVIKGIITRDADTKDYLKRRYMKSRVEDSGMPVIEPVDLNFETSEALVRKMFEEYEFINIPKPEIGLVPVDTEVNKIFTEVRAMLNECLEENGVNAGNPAPRVREKTVHEKSRTNISATAQNKETDRNKNQDGRDEI